LEKSFFFGKRIRKHIDKSGFIEYILIEESIHFFSAFSSAEFLLKTYPIRATVFKRTVPPVGGIVRFLFFQRKKRRA